MNVERLREARTLNEANGILNKLGANGAVRKLVETSFMTRTSPDSNTVQWGISCLNEAVSTLKDSEKPAVPESPGLKTKDDHFVKEEVLDNHNSTQRAAGSEQSTSNTGLPEEGKEEGDEDMQDASDTESQLTEMAPPGMSPGMMPGMGQPQVPGLAPKVATEMGQAMPPMPQFNNNQMMEQMQYTVKEALKPFYKHIQVQDKAIKNLSQKIRETQMQGQGLNLATAFQNRPLQETISQTPEIIPGTVVKNTVFDLGEKRNRLIQINDLMNETNR